MHGDKEECGGPVGLGPKVNWDDVKPTLEFRITTWREIVRIYHHNTQTDLCFADGKLVRTKEVKVEDRR